MSLKIVETPDELKDWIKEFLRIPKAMAISMTEGFINFTIGFFHISKTLAIATGAATQEAASAISVLAETQRSFLETSTSSIEKVIPYLSKFKEPEIEITIDQVENKTESLDYSRLELTESLNQ